MWNDLPWKFEAGTPDICGAVALAEAVKYLEAIGMDQVLKPRERVNQVRSRTHARMQQSNSSRL